MTPTVARDIARGYFLKLRAGALALRGLLLQLKIGKLFEGFRSLVLRRKKPVLRRSGLPG